MTGWSGHYSLKEISTVEAFVVSQSWQRDVTSLIPFGKAMQLGTKGMMVVGYAAPRLAAVSAVDATLSEIGLHATQETRTVGESAFAIGGGVILNTAIGTGISSSVDWKNAHGYRTVRR